MNVFPGLKEHNENTHALDGSRKAKHERLHGQLKTIKHHDSKLEEI